MMREELFKAMAEIGLNAPTIDFNSSDFQRWNLDAKDHKTCGWLKIHKIGDERILASFGSWRTCESKLFKTGKFSSIELDEHQRQIEEYKKQEQNIAANRAKDLFASAEEKLTQYCKRKNIRSSFGAKTDVDNSGEYLAVPLINVNGDIRNIQRIYNTGQKKFLAGGEVSGHFHLLHGDIRSAEIIYIAEGFATAATLCQALEHGAFVCAFSAKGLERVARELFIINPQAKFVLCADNDESGVGKQCAEVASNAVAGTVILCPVVGKDFNDIGEDATKACFQSVEIVKSDAMILAEFTGKHSLDSLALAKMCEGRILFYGPHGDWYQFNKVWRLASEDDIHKLFDTVLDRCIPCGWKLSQSEPLYKLTRRRISIKENWTADRNFLPFDNGILDINKMQLVGHDWKMHFNWCLPYDFDPEATCPFIDNFLKEISQDDKNKEEILITFLAAILRGRADLQRYLELIGQPGSGKGTYIKMAQLLVGMENNVSTTVAALSEPRFETANFFGKRLISVPDADRYGKSSGLIKSLTGRDFIRVEKKGKDIGAPFIYEGMFIMAGNLPIEFDDRSTALARRRIPVRFERTIDKVDPNIDEKIRKEIPGLFNKLLDIPNSWIDSVLTTATSTQYGASNEAMMRTNPIADWADHNLVLREDKSVRIGTGRKNNAGRFDERDTCLFPNFLQWAVDNQHKPITNNHFVESLMDIASRFKWQIRKKRMTDGIHYFGFRLRHKDDKDLPLFSKI